MSDLYNRVRDRVRHIYLEFKASGRNVLESLKTEADTQLNLSITSRQSHKQRYDYFSLKQRESGIFVCDLGTFELERQQTLHCLPDFLYENTKPGIYYTAKRQAMQDVWQGIVKVIREEERDGQGTISITGLEYFNNFYTPEKVRLTKKRIKTYHTRDIEAGSKEFLQMFEQK